MFEIYQNVQDIRDLPRPVATAATAVAAEALATTLRGIAIGQPQGAAEEAALERVGWRGIFESEGWAIGESRMIFEPAR